MKLWPRNFSIRHRVMALSLLPMTLLALVLGSYFTMSRVVETRANLHERGKALARLMASAAEFGVLSGNTDLLRSLSAGPVHDEDVADILFFDENFRLLYRSGQFDIEIQRNQHAPILENDTWRFVQPINVAALPLQDNPELISITQPSETVGWVAVVISSYPTVQREREILLRGIGLTLICLSITLIMANRFGRQITHPILRLTKLIERLQRGELDARADTRQTGELHTLATGINRLATRVQESTQQFEFRVDSATRRLTQALRHLEHRNLELQAERQRADAANHAKDEFLARMSHELRTPLTSVIGFTELLTHTPLDSDQKQYLQIINRTSELLLTIIDDILDFSRLESDAIKLEQISFDLEQSLFDVISAQSPSAARKGLELIADLPPDLPINILGDPARLCQILNNLVGNAIKFTEQGEVTLSVRARRPVGAPAQLLFRVRDTGIGIPGDRIGQLFTAFTQSDSSISRRFGGSGLGLVIAKRLVNLMHGRIELDSAEGRGTEVQVELPLLIPDHSPRPHCIAPLPAQSILLYEPHPGSRSALLRLLQPITAHVHLIQDLGELGTIKQPFTLLLAISPAECDQRSVQSLCDRVRAQTDQPIILLLPGHPPMQLRADAIKLLAKPVQPSTLYAHLGLQWNTHDSREPNENRVQLPYPLRILVAEDNDFNRLLIRRLLEGLGAQVRDVSNGREALEAIKQEQPELVLMDVHMPGMDGIQATREIRKHFADLPVIALTANVVPHEHQTLLSAGIDALLLKPINVAELTQTLLQQCERRSGQRLPSQPLNAQLQDSLQSIATPQALHAEIRRLSQGVMDALQQQDREQICSLAHQLIGVAGLYELPLLEDCTARLHWAAQEGSPQQLWRASSRLQRLAAQEQLE